MQKRGSWGSQIGFILAVAGSAIGLANIWKFPFIVGKYGGAAFVFIYLLCLLFIGYPVFMAEILIGRHGRTSPSGAFAKVGGPRWALAGKGTILTGFVVSAFYSAVAGWTLGYLFEAVGGRISSFEDATQAVDHFQKLLGNPWWAIVFHGLFMGASVGLVYLGVRKGIEQACRVMLPMLFLVLILLVFYVLSLPGASKGISFLIQPDWTLLGPAAFLSAMGHSFFTLSLGQGTMVTYASYVSRDDNLLQSTVPVVIMDTAVSLLSTIVIFCIVFSVGMEPDQGPSLMFQTLPLAFSKIPGGIGLAILFFLLVFLAAITSEISALEPSISYLVDERGWHRHVAVVAVGCGAFLLGIPCALSPNLLKHVTINGMTCLDIFDFVATNIMIPLGGFAAVVVCGWVWGTGRALQELSHGASPWATHSKALKAYFWFCFKYCAPALMLLVFLNALGLFG